MEKTIVIGIGGTGLDALRSLRRRVVEEHGSLTALPNLGYLYLDTDPKETAVTEDNRKKWEVLGSSIQLSSDEMFIIETPEIAPIIANIGAFPHIQSWFPVAALKSIDQSARDTPGARQVRPLGRFAFTLRTDAIASRFISAYNRLPQASGGGKTHIYIVGSLSGGTGSGMFLDLAYRIREWTNGIPELHGFLVMPDLTAGRGDRYLVNAYAALLELNYFNVGETRVRGEARAISFRLPLREKPMAGPPFDYCYLISPRNENRVDLNLDAIPEMIAHRLFLDFDSSFSDEAATLLNNASFQRGNKLIDPFTGNAHSQNFFTFGLSSIQYPTEEVTEILGYQLGSDLLSNWLRERAIPGNVNERVQAMLPDLRLTDDYLLGNKDFFGGKLDFEHFDREIDNFVNEIKRKAPSANAVSFINEQQRQCIDHFRSIGMLKFYQDKRDDLDGAVRTIQSLLATKSGTMLTEPALGYAFVERALDEMARLLTIKHQQFIDTLNGLPQKEAASRRALTGYFTQLEQAEHKLILKDKAVKEALGKVVEALKMNLSATIGIRAHDFGRAFLAKMLEEIKALRERIVDWRLGIERLREQAQMEIANRSEHLVQKNASGKDFNGKILFDETRLSAVYETLDRSSAQRTIESALASGDGGILDIPFHGEEVVDSIYHAALKWLTSESRIRVSDRTVADKLLDDFPDGAKRKTMLSENFAKSAAFLVFDEGQKQMYAGAPGIGYSYDPNSMVKLAALLDDDGATLKPVMQVKRDLEAATGLTASSIKKISDIDQILFLQEVTGFPLRVVKDVGVLRDRYREYIRNPEGLPVHIQATFDPPLPDLFLISEQEKAHVFEGQEAFLIAWVEDKIRSEQNKREGRDEIRYRFVELGSDSFVRLGATWTEAFDFVFADTESARRVRERVTSEITRVARSLDTHAKREDFAKRLASHFGRLREMFELGDEDSQYLMFEAIRRRIVEKYGLPFGVPTMEKDIAAGGAARSSDAEERFVTLFRTGLRNGRGTLTTAMSNMLEASRKRLGLSPERANALGLQVASEAGESAAVIEYRDMFDAFFEDGVINEEERAILTERQVELKLSQEQVDEIEATVIGRRGMGV